MTKLSQILGVPRSAVKKLASISRIMLILTLTLTYLLRLFAVSISQTRLLDDTMVKEEHKHVDSKIYQLIEMSQMANNVIKERLLNVNFLLNTTNNKYDIINTINQFICGQFFTNLRKPFEAETSNINTSDYIHWAVYIAFQMVYFLVLLQILKQIK